MHSNSRGIVATLRGGKICLNGALIASEVTMPLSAHPSIAARHDQAFPTLTPVEIDRLARFGEARSYPQGERVVTAGEVSPGLIIVLSGKIEVTQGGGLDRRE